MENTLIEEEIQEEKGGMPGGYCFAFRSKGFAVVMGVREKRCFKDPEVLARGCITGLE